MYCFDEFVSIGSANMAYMMDIWNPVMHTGLFKAIGRAYVQKR
jgi:hypothetical protein